MSWLATASMWWRSVDGQEHIAATVCRDSRSSGSGSINDSKFELAIQQSGTDGLDSTCCGSDAPSWPASKYWRGRFGGVIHLVITTGETASRVVVSVIADPAGIVASGMSRGGDRSIRLPSDDISSQSSTAARIIAISDWGWAEVTSDALKRSILRALCDHVLVSELLTGPTRQRQVHPLRLVCLFPSVEEGPATKPF